MTLLNSPVSLRFRNCAIPLLVVILGWVPFHGSAAPSEPYTIAIFTSSSGDRSREKVDAIRSYCRTRIEGINENGGINGTEVELLFFDDNYQADQTISIVAQALANDQLIGMLGISSSTRGAGIVQQVGESGVPLISEMSADSLFRDYPNIFTLSRSASHATEVFIRFLEKQLYEDRPATTLFIGNANDLYGKEFYDALKKPPQRVELLGEHLVESISPANLETIMADVRASDPDVISLAVGTSNGATVLQAFAAAEIRKPVYAVTGSIDGVLSGKIHYQGDVYKIAPSIPHVDNERLAALRRQSKVDEDDPESVYLSYGVSYGDMLTMMIESARRSADSSPEGMRSIINEELGKFGEGKKIFRGRARNWSFTGDRAVAMDGLIQWRPGGTWDTKLFPRQILETSSGPKSVPVVYTNIDMTRIFHVDSAAKTFDAEFYISLSSDEDIRLSSFEFTNAHRGADSGEELISFHEMREQGANSVRDPGEPRLYRVRGRFDFAPELSEYPFDSQLFSISFQPVNTSEPFLFQPPPRKMRDVDFDFKNWTLMKGTNSSYVGSEEDIIATTHRYGSERRVQTINRYNFTWLAKRIVLDYYLQVVIPLALIVFVAYLSVFIPNSKFESVVAIQVTALLSSIALYLSIPKLGTETATISDQIFLFIQAMIGLMLALSIVRVNAVSRNFRKLTIGIMVLQIIAFPVMAFLMYYYLAQIS